MSLVVAAIAAAGVGLAAGAVAVGSWWRRRRRAAAGAAGGAAAEPPALAAPPAADGMPLGLGDVVQVDEETRWLCAGLEIGDGAATRCSLWFASEGDGTLAVAVFPPPARHVYWLARKDLDVPVHPPSRLEMDGRLLERVATFPAVLAPVGSPPVPTDGGVVSWYEGAVGDAALTLHHREGCAAYGGRRLDEGAYDRMGAVAPDEEPADSASAP